MNDRSIGENQPCGTIRARMLAASRLVTLIALAALVAALGAFLAPGSAAHAEGTGYWQVAAGGNHTCAVVKLSDDPLDGGPIVCWGADGYGQSTPPDIPDARYTQVSAGEYHTCGLRTDGAVDCWGYNFYGQATDRVGPFTKVSAGYGHVCALAPGGSAQCWGRNDYGQAVSKSGPFTQISAGQVQNCGLKTSGAVDCWGADDYGQATDQAGPFTRVTAGGVHNCAIVRMLDTTDEGLVFCWGDDSKGQSTPENGNFTEVSAGHTFTCGIRSDKSLDCWGYDFYGQVSKAPAGRFNQVDAGHGHACAVSEGDAVVCWGRNDHGQAKVPALGGPATTLFDFAGFYPPVEPEPELNEVKAGSAVPLKFSLGGDQGLDVIAPDSPASQPVNCTDFSRTGALEPVAPAGGSALSGSAGLRYDPVSGQYTYVWKTEKAWAGQCRMLSLMLADETEHLVAFEFK